MHKTKLAIFGVLLALGSSAHAAPQKKLLPITVKGRAALTKLVDNLFAAKTNKANSAFKTEILSAQTPTEAAKLKADMLKQAQNWSPKNPSWKWDGKTSVGALSDLYTEIKFGPKTTTYLEVD